MKQSKISESAIRRLSRYYRYLEQLGEKEGKVISSAQLAAKCMVNPNQLRKDLNFFGEFGTRGLGYHVKDLLSDIRQV
ncbi:MAG: winged-helix domain-containing protein, partial [Thermodesulfobacteriota bacterium]